ncbi:MAG: hypothetical protein VX899_01100 [Myxococcota bacterium]|nr:hypothetical protein [Myxococcota bacterium]
MLLLLLGCALQRQGELTLPSTPACLNTQVSATLPDLDVRELEVLEGDIPARHQGRELQLRLPAQEPGLSSVLVRYRAGPLGIWQRMRVSVPRSDAPVELAAEAPNWRILFTDASLSPQARKRANVLGFEGEIELRLELCVQAGVCTQMPTGSAAWAPRPLAQDSSVRLRDQDLVVRQKLTSKTDVALGPGARTLNVDDSELRLQIQEFSAVPDAPSPLPLDTWTRSRVRFDGPYPDAWLVELPRAGTLKVALFSPEGGTTLDLHRCDGAPHAGSEDPLHSLRTLNLPLDQGQWLLRVGLAPLETPAATYQLFATTDPAAFQAALEEKGLSVEAR